MTAARSRRCAAIVVVLLTFSVSFGADKHPHPDNSKPTPVPKYVSMPSGVDFYDITDGTGPEAVLGRTLKVNYTGWLTSGKKFDSSYDRGEPFVFKLGPGVIRGWVEGLQGMKVGGKRQIRIPSDLAYGPHGQPPSIPPNATLIFDIELLEVR